MTLSARLSSKQALLSERGFALNQSEQPGYQFDWHEHDCAMLMWPQVGALQCDWLDAEPAGHQPQAVSARLGRAQAILLPASTAHQTVGDARRQRHGELYLAPELVRRGFRYGALCLDLASESMLRALAAPTLDAQTAEPLVHAIVTQLRHGRLAPLPAQRDSLARQVVAACSMALERGNALPSIESIANDLGVSTRQLQRACERDLGASPVAIRRRVLARHARALLKQGRSLAEVSAQLDFATSGHLSRLLKAVDD